MAQITKKGNFRCLRLTGEEYDRFCIERENFFKNIPTPEEMERIRKEHDFSEQVESSLSKEIQDWQKTELEQVDFLEEMLKKKQDIQKNRNQESHLDFSQTEEDMYRNCPKGFEELNKIMIECMKESGLL